MDYKVGTDEVLRYIDRIYVPNSMKIRKMILEEGHRKKLCFHPHTTQMYKDLKIFW